MTAEGPYARGLGLCRNIDQPGADTVAAGRADLRYANVGHTSPPRSTASGFAAIRVAFSDFRGQTLARLAAQHDEIILLR